MDKPSAFFLHHNRGVKKLAFTVRDNREIRFVKTKPFNHVLQCQRAGHTLIITKGLCGTAQRLGRLKLTPYTGKWPVLTLLWTRFKEVIRNGR
ncbi:hypothetical protein [Ectopseudomonas oleovorans]|uniref:Uncharacterized protein n=1 Tax=Ectopseudomonas oleovorans TaxID=301 RepID=A0AA42QB47_ECTOL|nr:hypothetical protein [Pseudomonas oleovorans]MDH1340539.1 hypothetical protein [Pseudomonas oleovorans]MDH1491511.1 hypothetical protein [Pseudomonas oleovorans]WGG22386.1 hypothetical protein N5O83_06875 [Pseudomonas oleovorans]